MILTMDVICKVCGAENRISVMEVIKCPGRDFVISTK